MSRKFAKVEDDHLFTNSEKQQEGKVLSGGEDRKLQLPLVSLQKYNICKKLKLYSSRTSTNTLQSRS